MIYGQNRQALEEKRTFPDGALDRIACYKALKTDALKHTLSGERPRYRLNHTKKVYEGGPEHRALHRHHRGRPRRRRGQPLEGALLLPRITQSQWDVGDQPPEFWNQFKTEFASGTHLRIHPLLDWTELNIWEYIRREGIPTVSLYYNQGNRKRFRSLGCYPCTQAVESDARNVDDIIMELKSGKFANIAEGSGRAQDRDGGGGLETLRPDGYM
jgi:sulfate adenylyltransferase subunit 2